MAANTAFAGLPTLLSVIAQDGYAPWQLKLRGHRLNFTNGIMSLGILAIILVIPNDTLSQIELIPAYSHHVIVPIDSLRNKWAILNTDIPLIIRHSPYREVVGPLGEYIDSEEHASQPDDIITVLLPQFFVPKWWQTILHNNTSLFIANAMFSKRNVVVSILPFYVEDLHKYKAKVIGRTPTEDL